MHHKSFKRLLILSIFILTSIIPFSASAISLKGKTVLIDGDSLARGSHATVNDGRYSYGDYLGTLGADVTNIAVSRSRFYNPGGGDEEIANHLSGSVTGTSFDYIVLQGGDNDVDHYSNLDNTYASIESYFQTVKNNSAWKNSQIFFVITPHMSRSSSVLNKANDLWKKVKRLCTKYRIRCINFFKTGKNDGNSTPPGFKYNLMDNRISFSENATVEGSVDGSHPSQKAHITMGKEIARRFKVSSNDPSNTPEEDSPKSDSTYTPSISTYDGIVETNYFGNMKDEGQGCGVNTVLSLVIDALSIVVAILALIGIAFVGTKYIMAKGDIEQAKNAKHRLYQIIFGLVAYVLLYAGVQWLLPGGHFNNNQNCSTISDAELAKLREKQRAERQKRAREAESDPESLENKTNEQIRAELANTAIRFAGSPSSPNGAYRAAFRRSGLISFENDLCRDRGWCDSNRLKAMSCSSYVATVVRTVIPSEKTSYKTSKGSGWKEGFPTPDRNVYRHLQASSHWQEVPRVKAQPGDVEIQIDNGYGAHVAIIVKRIGNKLISAEASNGQFYPVVQNQDTLWHQSRKYYRYYK